LFKSDYNSNKNGDENKVDKTVLITEIKTILSDQNLIDQNKTVIKEEDIKAKRVGVNQNATRKAKDAATKARLIAKSTRNVTAKALPPRQIINLGQAEEEEARKQAEEEARKAAEEEARKAARKEAAKQKAAEEEERKAAEEAARKAAEEAARKAAAEQARQKAAAEEAKQEEAAGPLQKIIDLFSNFILPTEKQKDNPPKPESPPSFNVPSLSGIKQNQGKSPTTTAQQRFKEQRTAEINEANNPMNFIKKGLQGLYKGITNITNIFKSEEKGEKSNPLRVSNSPAVQCKRDPGKRQELHGFRKTLGNEARDTRRQPGVARRVTRRDTDHTQRRRAPRQQIIR